MIKSNKLTIWMALVLTSGLVSCAPNKEKVTKDVYKAPVPVVLKGAQNIDLRGWDQASQKDLDLQDGFDVRAANAASVDLVSRCRRGDSDLYRSVTLPGSQPIRLYQAIPVELIAHDFAQVAVSCSFEITLRNGAGSKHIYNVAAVVIKDERPGPTALEVNGTLAPQARQQFRVSRLEGTQVRSNPAMSGQAQLVCADGISAELNFDTVGGLGVFDFNKMQVFPSHDSVAFGRQPIQLCRVIVAQSGVVKGLTSLFELQFNHTPLTVVPVALHSRGQSVAESELQTAVSGAPVVFGEYRIQNDGTAPRIVRVQKANLPVRTYSIHVLQSVHMITRPFVAVQIKPGPTSQLTDEGGSYKIQIGPKGYFDLAVAFKAAAAAQCPFFPNSIRNPIASLVLEPAQALNLDEITETNRALIQTPIDLGPRIYFGTTAANAARYNLIFRGEHSQCGW